MKRSKVILFNTLLLTAAAMLMRAVGVFFQVYLSNKIGSAGIGLFQLIGSVETLAMTVAISGVRYATTRLVAEELGLDRPRGAVAAVRRCLGHALFFGCLAAGLLFSFSNLIGSVWIGDSRTVLSLRLLACALPFSAMSAVIAGYFTAVQRVIKSAGVQIAENLIRIAAIVFFLRLVPPNNLEYACAAVVAGGVFGEIMGLFFIIMLYLYDKKRLGKTGAQPKKLVGRLLHISLPVAASAYARSALSTLEHMLVPRGLKKSGASGDTALELYGTIHGMVFPIIMFPSAVFYSMSELIVPELTEAQVVGNTAKIEFIVNRVLSLCLLFSIGVAGILLCFHKEFGDLLYRDAEVGKYIFIFAFLMPVIYMDAITDGMLKGLGQQLHSMAYNVADSLISVILVYTLLPIYSIRAYIFIVYFTESFNFFLSIRRISKVTNLKLRIRDIVLPALCIAGAVNFATLLLRTVGIIPGSGGLTLTFSILVSGVIYIGMLLLLGSLTKNDVRWFREILK